MLKRSLISLVLGLAIAAGTVAQVAAQAGPPPIASAIERLETEGYTVIDTRRSWLGRIVVLSTRGDYTREMVLNRTTGTVLSDRLFPIGAAGADARGEDAGTGEATKTTKPQGRGQNGAH